MVELKNRSENQRKPWCHFGTDDDEVGGGRTRRTVCCSCDAGWPTRSGNDPSKRSEWNSCSGHGGIRRKDWNLRLHGNEETDSSKELPKRIPDSGMNGDTEPEKSVV